MTATTAPPSSATPVDSTALPLCEATRSSGSGQPSDCKLISRDRAGLTFVVRYATGKKGPANIAIIRRDNSVQQTLLVQIDTYAHTPSLLELADDGRDQLVFPLITGTINSTYAVYRATDSAPDFVPVGEVFGIAVNRTASGYIVGEARGGSAGKYWYKEFWQFADSHLRLMARLLITRNYGPPDTCAINDESGLKETPAVTDPEAIQRFCAEQVLRADPVK